MFQLIPLLPVVATFLKFQKRKHEQMYVRPGIPRLQSVVAAGKKLPRHGLPISRVSRVCHS